MGEQSHAQPSLSLPHRVWFAAALRTDSSAQTGSPHQIVGGAYSCVGVAHPPGLGHRSLGISIQEAALGRLMLLEMR